MPALLPVLGWMRRYDLQQLRGDLLASITLAAYVIPAALGDASLADLPPESGLYACLFAGGAFWLFCSSRLTVISVTSAISLLMGASLGEIAKGDSTRFVALAAGAALLVAGIAFAAWAVKAGSVVNFISESVMTGFKCGVALVLASTQLPKLLGIPGAHGSFWVNAGHLLKHLQDTHVASFLAGGTALALLLLGKAFFKRKPVALFIVLGGIAASTAFSLEARGVKLLGDVPRGLPAPGLPAIRLEDLNELLPLAFAAFLLAAVETAAIGRMFAQESGERLDVNQELLAIAAANLASGIGHGFPVSGGMSQSLVNQSSGARTPFSTALAAGLLLLVVLFFSHLLRPLPQPVLAAIVIAAVAGLFQASALKHLWRSSRSELLIALATMLGVLGSGLLRGVLIGAIFSLVQLLRSASRPHVATLGRIPGTRRFSDRSRHPDNELIPGVQVFRPEASLFYFNVDHVRDTIASRVRAEPEPPQHVILDLSAAPQVDLQSAHTLAALADDLASVGARLQVVETRSSVRERLRAEGLDSRLGGIDRFTSVADAIEHSRPPHPDTGNPPQTTSP